MRSARFMLLVENDALFMIKKNEVKLIKEANNLLDCFQRDYNLEKRISKEYIKTHIEREQYGILGANLCLSCGIFVNHNSHLSDEEAINAKLPDCCEKRMYKNETKNCEKYVPCLDSSIDVQIARENFNFYNKFLHEIDKGILERLKIR